MKKTSTPDSAQPPHEASAQTLLPFQEKVERVNVEELAREIDAIIGDLPILNDERLQRQQDRFDERNGQ